MLQSFTPFALNAEEWQTYLTEKLPRKVRFYWAKRIFMNRDAGNVRMCGCEDVRMCGLIFISAHPHIRTSNYDQSLITLSHTPHNMQVFPAARPGIPNEGILYK